MSEKMMSRKLAMPLLGILLWVISTHAGTFAAANLLPRPLTGADRTIYTQKALLPPTKIFSVKIGEKDLNRSVSFGNGVINRMLRLETNLDWSNIHVKKDTPAHGQLIVNLPEKEALKQGKDALIAIKATIHLMNIFCNKHKATDAQCLELLSSLSLHSTPLRSSCERLQKYCSEEDFLSPYRKIDGACNHKVLGARGTSFSSYKRFLLPEYLDGIQEPRRSVSKRVLPSARLVSTSLVDDANRLNEDSDLTLAVMQWSQFSEHDLSHTAISKMVHTEKTIECCAASGSNLSPRYIHPFCAPISVPEDDRDYAKHGLDCMTYVRSVPALRDDCSFGPVDQVNQATHYLDMSQVYGATVNKATALRELSGGRLDVSKKNERTFLPLSHRPAEDCQTNGEQTRCYLSGDTRVNVHPQLTAMHTIWVREHNRIASVLKALNPHWDDEKLYQEARRIVIAEYQHITYNEWIPVILGRKYVNKLQTYGKYNEDVNPSASNSFATAAIRALNSLMNGRLKLYEESRLVNASINLRNHFNKPHLLEENGYFDALIRGLATQSSQKMGFNFPVDITSHLFSNGHYGYDVLSLDIQRGRDHGLPSYNDYRVLCGLPKATSFEGFSDVMSSNIIKSLSELYDDPQDVDLIVGGISENAEDDSLLGPTLSCLIADQFLRTRRGDRYFYTNEDQPSPFSKSQIRSIEKVTLARIFCDNSDDIRMMQPHVFKTIDANNELVNCNSEDIPRLNLKLWTDARIEYF